MSDTTFASKILNISAFIVDENTTDEEKSEVNAVVLSTTTVLFFKTDISPLSLLEFCLVVPSTAQHMGCAGNNNTLAIHCF